MNAVEINNLSFSYNDSNDVLNIKNFSIKKGESIFIHGPSGSGKSTFLNLISGILTPQTGKIIILNEDLTLKSTVKRDIFRGDHLGYIFQQFNLIPYLSIYENILLPLKSSKVKKSRISGKVETIIQAYLRQLDLLDYMNASIDSLSVGQQQRVAAIRAFVGKPEIIIADEPTSSLDEESTKKFIELLKSEYDKNEFTLIFVSHDKNLARHFDRSISLLDFKQGVQ